MNLFSPERRLAGHYSREGEHYLVEVRLNDPRGLFNSFDPAPFIEKDLDGDAEDYIVDTVQDFPFTTPLKPVLQIEKTNVRCSCSVMI